LIDLTDAVAQGYKGMPARAPARNKKNSRLVNILNEPGGVPGCWMEDAPASPGHQGEDQNQLGAAQSMPQMRDANTSIHRFQFLMMPGYSFSLRLCKR
jgi:hypothetical protein